MPAYRSYKYNNCDALESELKPQDDVRALFRAVFKALKHSTHDRKTLYSSGRQDRQHTTQSIVQEQTLMTHPTRSRLKPVILFTALFCLPSACATTHSPAPAKTAKGAPITASKPGGNIIRPEADSVCRGYIAPANSDTRGCTITGPYPGELTGEELAKEMSLEKALAHCVNTPGCSGISASWYVGAKFIPIAAKTEFTPDGGSYGCTFTVTSCAPQPK